MQALLASTTEVFKFETALLLLVTAGLLVLAKIVSDLRAEVRRLRAGGPAAVPAQPAATPAAQPVASPAPAPAAASVPPDVLAVIVSAVYHTLGDNHHIVSVSPAESLMWSREGRRSIFRSHSIR